MAENVVPITGVKEERLKIGDLARLGHRSTRALRLYEEMGLLGAYRSNGGHRLYGKDALVRLEWIDKLQTLGFSLHQIKQFLDDVHEVEGGPNASMKVREIYREKLDEIRAQIKSLEALAGELQDSLTYLESCHACSPSTLVEACASCDHQHAVAPPTLIMGIHRGEGDN